MEWSFFWLGIAIGASAVIVTAVFVSELMLPKLKQAYRNMYRGYVGDKCVRDPQAPCEYFNSDEVIEPCFGDGHYLCEECHHFEPEPKEDNDN